MGDLVRWWLTEKTPAEWATVATLWAWWAVHIFTALVPRLEEPTP